MYATSLGWVALLEQGDPRFLDRFATFVAVGGTQSGAVDAGGALIDRSIIAALQGRFAEAAASLDEAFAMLPGDGHPVLPYMAHHLRWALLLLQGRFDEVAELAGRSAGVGYPYPALLAGITAAARGDVERPRGAWPRWVP